MAVAELTLPRLSKPLRLWEKIELVVGEGSDSGHYAARIEDFAGDGIVIDSPEFISGSTLLRQGSSVLVLITRDDAVYQCYSTIRKHRSEGGNRFLLTRPRQVTRVQRRQFVRIDMLTPVQWARIDTILDYDAFDEALDWIKSSSLNISGGGILLRVTPDLHVGDKLLLRIGLFPELELPEIVAAVCRRRALKDKQWLAGVEFILQDHLEKHFSQDELDCFPKSVKQYDRAGQNRLVTFTFQKQIELRQKGLL